MAKPAGELTYKQRLEALRETKMRQTEEKWEVIGSDDGDDHGRILPPAELGEMVEYMGPSGEPVKDVKIKGFKPKTNHLSGDFLVPKYVAKTLGVSLNFTRHI